MPKFMQTISTENFEKLKEIAKKKGIKVQELIRVVIVPEWIEDYEEAHKQPGKTNSKKLP